MPRFPKQKITDGQGLLDYRPVGSTQVAVPT